MALQANGGLHGVPPLLTIKEDERKRQQKEARRFRNAEYGPQLQLLLQSTRTRCDSGGRYKQGDAMRSMQAADAEDKDYEQRLLKVDDGPMILLVIGVVVTNARRWRGWWSRLRRRSSSSSRCPRSSIHSRAHT